MVESGPNITIFLVNFYCKTGVFITELQQQKGFFEITILTLRNLNANIAFEIKMRGLVSNKIFFYATSGKV